MGIICSARTYKYKGWYFEFGVMIVWPLKKNGDPLKRVSDEFWDVATEFGQLPDGEKEEYRAGGGCQQF